MDTANDPRIRRANDQPLRSNGAIVLYWMQMYRRLSHNHALDRAVQLAQELGKPLVIYEGLKLNYPWANARFHQFILEGMAENCAEAKRLGVTYWPFVETPKQNGHGLVKQLAADACVVVTDDYPHYIVPAHIRALACTTTTAVFAVDGNSVVALSQLGAPTAAAAHLRPRIHKLFAEAWQHRANAKPDFKTVAGKKPLKAPFEPWTPPKDLTAFVRSLPIDQSVPALPEHIGGTKAGRVVLQRFIETKRHRYGAERSDPDNPQRTAASGLSAYLHYGHVSIEEVVASALGDDWTPELINAKTRNKSDFYCRDESINSFLDEAVTWRDVGFQWHFAKMMKTPTSGSKNRSWQADDEQPSFNFQSFDYSPLERSGTLQQVLPEWARNTLEKHTADPREHLYTPEQFELGRTQDELWNAAQRELVVTGRIHNYLRMLWAKKVLEWSKTPEDAYRTLEFLNNKYAIDGRDPNSYTGILWCFGLFDRPWPPERQVFGNIRYMSSTNTAKKFKLAGYFEYIRSLPTIAETRSGTPAPRRAVSLFD